MDYHARFASIISKRKVLTVVGVLAFVTTPFLISAIASAAIDLQQSVGGVSAAHPVTDSIKDLPEKERATRKGQAIAQIGSIPKVRRGKYFIEVESMEPIDGGVQMFVKAWDANGTPIGFGKDGTVEIERIRSFNPPILVGNPKGDIIITQSNPATATTTETTIELARYHEDLKEATLRDLEHTLSVKKEMFGPERIIPGKVGRTTDTFRSAAGANDPVDGRFSRYIPGASETFSSIRTGNGAGSDSDTTQATDRGTYLYSDTVSGKYILNRRALFIFDTSPISTGDSIGSATFSFKVPGLETGLGNPDFHLFWGSSASNSTLADSDYQSNLPSTSIGNVPYATLNANLNSNPTLATFNNVSLTDVSNINKGTGARTKLGGATQWDINNSAPTWISDVGSSVQVFFADTTGTADDPKLVVEHSVSPIAPTVLQVAPSFSAVFNDTSGDTAVYYQLQIGTYSSIVNWTTPYWDSGKQNLSSSTSNGQRSPAITSTSTLSAGQTYYWRIKFWDQSNVEGAWSTTTPILMIAN